MFNTEKPNLEDLPSSKQLLKSTYLAAAAAGALLITVVLPAEYGIDPTGVGRLIGLKEMGEIKSQLAEEAEQDAVQSSVGGGIYNFLIGTAYAQEVELWTDEISFTLASGEGIEWKITMEDNAIAEFDWFTDGGRINFDLHGDAPGQSISYEKGRGQSAARGEIVAAFSGNHGWFFRNRGSGPVTVSLRLRGAYGELIQTF
ncbi:transmembrane anchor protein [Cochlodiniinecator piscidefendens]|uniref:transmembrane anchor protein n=1 Tax=Cochlodiniinecator piscidefendens TaxID=2715756 RepID=UPI00140A3EA6|nr:transmembrane anchor protein [Cochlodiniinecator piscidefendens]